MLKISQIGIGYWGPNLLRNLQQNRDCEVVSVIDLDKDRLKFVNNQYPSIKTSSDLNIALNDSDVDAVVISTPAKTHFELSIKSLEKGKHILVEKPMATSVEQIDQISKLATSNGLVAMVGHTYIYNPAVRYIKKIIDSGEIGNLRYIHSQRLNLGRIRSDIDALWNFAPHDISIIQYILQGASPNKVTRLGMDYVQNGVQDVVFLNISYPGKIIANIHVSWLNPHKVRKMLIVGSEKMIVYDDVADNKIAIYDKGIDVMSKVGEKMDFDKPGTFEFNYRSGDITYPNFEWEEPLSKEIEHFLDCIINGKKCLTDTKHAREVVRILESQTND